MRPYTHIRALPEIERLKKALAEKETQIEDITAERNRYKAALEVIAGGSQDKLREIQAKAALANIGPSIESLDT